MSAETWMRVVLFEQEGAANDGSLKKELEGFIRVLQKQKGYQIGFAGEDPDDSALATVTQWSSLAAIEAADEVLRPMIEDAATRGIRVVDRQNIQLFTPAPSMHMWSSSSDEEAVEEKPKHKHRFHLRH
jgi:hypothetical protein